jgi:hypothetical protein
MTLPLPNFFVIGAPKCGTTALYHSLKQHPEIFMSRIKEPHYFLFGGREPGVSDKPGGMHYRQVAVWRPEKYLNLFEGSEGSRAVGEASTSSIRHPEVARRIHANIPDAKIIAILRQPAERAYSHFLYMVKTADEPAATFQEALDEEEMRREQGWLSGLFHKSNGYYYRQLSAYYDLFPRNQIRVYIYDDWNAAPGEVLADMFAFLGVDTGFRPTSGRHNTTVVPRLRKLNQLAMQPEVIDRKLGRLATSFVRRACRSVVRTLNTRFNLVAPPPLDPSVRNRLTLDYSDDIRQLQELIGRDLSHWLE